MTEPEEGELARLAAEVAEHLRFEHDVGAIGVLELALAPTEVRGGERPTRAAATDRGAATSRGETVTRVASPAPRPPAAAVARPVEVSSSDVDALLARARRARGKAAPEADAPAPMASPIAASGPRAPAPIEPAVRLAILEEARAAAAKCTACRLHESRTQSVFSRGDPGASIVFVGEGPGFNEDKQGMPFVGAAGQLLDKMVAAMGYSREAVYICNTVKCRPPENRTPLPDEVAACASFLDTQLQAVQPRIIVALGRCAAERLGCAEAGRSWRGSWGEYRGVPVMPTYHPAYLLRNAEMKRPVWEDLQKVTARLAKSDTPDGAPEGP